MGKVTVISEERVYDEYLKIDKGIVKHEKNGSIEEYSRFKLYRPDAVACLVLNTETNKFILVKQFRFPIAHREDDNVLEVAAGKIDENETPREAAVRELKEELGYEIDPEKLEDAHSLYASPGYSTEKIHFFIAYVTNDMKISDGGGLESEHEDIEIVEIDADSLVDMVNGGEITDLKTYSIITRYIFSNQFFC